MSIKRSAMLAGASAILAGLLFVAPAVAQEQETPQAPPAAAPRAAPPRPTPKAGYVVPPENSAGLYPVNGEPIFKAKCAQCHDPAVDRAPTRIELGARAPEDVYDALTIGAMKGMATGLSDAELYGVVRYITGKSPTPNASTAPDSNPCRTQTPLKVSGPMWNGWSTDVTNQRYQAKPGFKAADVPKLKVKWSFSYQGTKNTEPLIFGDRVYVGSMSGHVYSLDTKTGCVHWRFDYRGGGRASMTIGKNKAAPSGYALYVSDDRQVVHAIDARDGGKELWSVQVFDHKVGRITGSPTLYGNLLYVPMSGAEESQANVGTYGCCTFIGAIVAVDVTTGKVAWTRSILNEQPHPTRLNKAGTQMYGPAGGSIWSAPTIDAKRGLLYAATGDSFTEVEHPASDAVVAMDLKTGEIKWIKQVLANDNFVSGGPTSANAPLGKSGPDYDFGSSPMLVKMPNGKDALVTPNKSAIMYAMNPDNGDIIWESEKLGSGGANGGFLWGGSTDGKIVVGGLNDFGGPTGKPGVVALDLATGKEVWRYNAKPPAVCNVPSGRCAAGFGAATTSIPGVVFAGDGSGQLYAFDAKDGHILWSHDATGPFDTVNGLKDAPGGSMSMGGPTIAGGMMFVHSGYNGTAGANDVLLAYSPEGK